MTVKAPMIPLGSKQSAPAAPPPPSVAIMQALTIWLKIGVTAGVAFILIVCVFCRTWVTTAAQPGKIGTVSHSFKYYGGLWDMCFFGPKQFSDAADFVISSVHARKLIPYLRKCVPYKHIGPLIAEAPFSSANDVYAAGFVIAFAAVLSILDLALIIHCKVRKTARNSARMKGQCLLSALTFLSVTMGVVIARGAFLYGQSFAAFLGLKLHWGLGFILAYVAVGASLFGTILSLTFMLIQKEVRKGTVADSALNAAAGLLETRRGTTSRLVAVTTHYRGNDHTASIQQAARPMKRSSRSSDSSDSSSTYAFLEEGGPLSTNHRRQAPLENRSPSSRLPVKQPSGPSSAKSYGPSAGPQYTSAPKAINPSPSMNGVWASNSLPPSPQPKRRGL